MREIILIARTTYELFRTMQEFQGNKLPPWDSAPQGDFGKDFFMKMAERSINLVNDIKTPREFSSREVQFVSALGLEKAQYVQSVSNSLAEMFIPSKKQIVHNRESVDPNVLGGTVDEPESIQSNQPESPNFTGGTRIEDDLGSISDNGTSEPLSEEDMKEISDDKINITGIPLPPEVSEGMDKPLMSSEGMMMDLKPLPKKEEQPDPPSEIPEDEMPF